MAEPHLSEQELNERVRILHKLRGLLEEQRTKFREYLNVLEKQEQSIADEDTEKLLAHTELEQRIIGGIGNLQKVIKPMEALYKSSHGSYSQTDIPILQADLAQLQSKILQQNEKNRNALRTRIDSVRLKLDNVRNPYKNTRSVYVSDDQNASLINIET